MPGRQQLDNLVQKQQEVRALGRHTASPALLGVRFEDLVLEGSPQSAGLPGGGAEEACSE